jgi:hypothetical protein
VWIRAPLSFVVAFVVACIAMSACSKPSSRQASAESGAQHSALVSAQAATIASPTTPAAQSAAVAALPSTQNATTPAALVTQSQPSQSQTSQSQTSAALPLVASDETLGPFHVGDQIFTFVKHVEKIQDSKSSDDTSVEWWELRDASGKAVQRQQYGLSFQNGAFDETEDVSARELKGKFGQGILVDGMSLPSAPGSGWWVQLFGLFDKKLVPFSPVISTDGEFVGEDVSTFTPSAMFRGQQMQPVSHDILKFRLWTGSFSIYYNLVVDWIQGKVRPEWICSQRTSKGPSSACRYKVEVEAHRGSELTFVRLFSEPDEGFTPKHAVIKPDSKIEFIEAQLAVSWSSDQDNISFGVANSDKIWLHIKVDGQDGWITSEEDFEALGLSMAG